jgi:hypothetical protein
MKVDENQVLQDGTQVSDSLAAATAAMNIASVELVAVTDCVLDRYVTAPLLRTKP